MWRGPLRPLARTYKIGIAYFPRVRFAGAVIANSWITVEVLDPVIGLDPRGTGEKPPHIYPNPGTAAGWSLCRLHDGRGPPRPRRRNVPEEKRGPFRARARMMPATNAQDFPETRQGRMDDGAVRMFRRCGAGGLRTRFGRGIFPAAGSLPATRRKS
jgi:hypothetical protein